MNGHGSARQTALVKTLLGDRPVVLVGLMGAGKSSIGRRLAAHLAIPFVDADTEIEKAAGCSVSDIFELYGEAGFRDGERRVIARLLGAGGQVLATGGGAFLDPDTRAAVKQAGVSIWLRAELSVLVQRTSRRDTRPLLKNGDPETVLRRLMEQRYPVYAEADTVVDTGSESPDATTAETLRALERFLTSQQNQEIARQ